MKAGNRKNNCSTIFGFGHHVSTRSYSTSPVAHVVCPLSLWWCYDGCWREAGSPQQEGEGRQERGPSPAIPSFIDVFRVPPKRPPGPVAICCQSAYNPVYDCCLELSFSNLKMTLHSSTVEEMVKLFIISRLSLYNSNDEQLWLWKIEEGFGKS